MNKRCRPVRVGTLLRTIMMGAAGIFFGVLVENATAQTAPRITKANFTEGALVLSWEGGSGFYELQAASRLNPAKWRPFLRTALKGARITTDLPYGFFRLMAVRP